MNTFYQVQNNPIVYFVDEHLYPYPHLHREVELVYVEKGKARAFADNGFYDIGSGDFFISFPNQVHYYESSVAGKYHVLIILPDIIYGAKQTLLEKCPQSSAVKVPDPSLLHALFCAIASANGKYAETERAGIILKIMSMMLSLFELKPRIKSDNPTLAEILTFCEQNFQEELNLEVISEKLHLNKYYISHLFNQKMGIGFSAYLNRIRISRACDLLSETDRKTSDISEEVGFGSIRSFNRAFCEVMNTTPLKYRSLRRAKSL